MLNRYYWLIDASRLNECRLYITIWKNLDCPLFISNTLNPGLVGSTYFTFFGRSFTGGSLEIMSLPLKRGLVKACFWNTWTKNTFEIWFVKGSPITMTQRRKSGMIIDLFQRGSGFESVRSLGKNLSVLSNNPIPPPALDAWRASPAPIFFIWVRGEFAG